MASNEFCYGYPCSSPLERTDKIYSRFSKCVSLLCNQYTCKSGHIQYICKTCNSYRYFGVTNAIHLYGECFSKDMYFHISKGFVYVLLPTDASQTNIDAIAFEASTLFRYLPQTACIKLDKSLMSQINISDVDFMGPIDNHSADALACSVGCSVQPSPDGKKKYIVTGSRNDTSKLIADKISECIAQCRFCDQYYDSFPTEDMLAAHINSVHFTDNGI